MGKWRRPIFPNLRRIKLFLNKIGRSLELVAHEVNVEDFIRLELIRDIEPSLYERIYQDRDRFWNPDFAIEARYKSPYLDKEAAKKDREEFYEKLKASVPAERRYVFRLLGDLFPQFAKYEDVFGVQAVNAEEAENARRIFHPRCFRQYFLLKVPSEALPQEGVRKIYFGFTARKRRRGSTVFWEDVSIYRKRGVQALALYAPHR